MITFGRASAALLSLSMPCCMSAVVRGGCWLWVGPGPEWKICVLTIVVHLCVLLLAAGVPKALLGHQVTVLGVRPVFPPFTPKEYVALAQQCWAPRPEDRWVFLPGRCFLHCCRLGLEPLQLGGLIMPGDKSHMLAAAT